MQSVGQRLREARLQIGRSLEDVSFSTRIPVAKLRAIEADQVEELGSPFFYKSFVRQFARAVKLDENEIAQDIQAAASTLPEPLMPGQSHTPPPGLSALPVRRSRNFKWLNSIASLMMMMVICSVVYAMWQNARTHREPAVDLVPAQQRLIHKTPQVRPVPVARPPATNDAETPEASPSDADAPYRIQLSAIEPTWLSIHTDGREIFSGILQATGTKIVEPHERARIRTGNAGGVNVFLNGKDLGTIGPRGQVRTVVFTKDAYEVLSPAPHISLTAFNPNGE